MSTLTGNATFCSFERQQWDFINMTGVDAPHLLCDTHGQPASGEVYECDPGAEVGLCQPEAEYLDDHTGPYGVGRVGKDVVVDETRCRCGRPAATCHGRADALLTRSHLDTLAAGVPA